MTFEPARDTGPVVFHRNVSPDLIGFLPAAAADKLRTLRQHVEDLHLLVPVFEDRKTANEAKFVAEKRLERLQAHASEGGFSLLDTDRRVVDQKREIKKLADDARRITAMYEARSAAWDKAGQTLTRVEAWLTDGRPPGTVLENYQGETPKLGKGENLLDAINDRRRQVAELKSQLVRIRNAPLPSSHAKRRVVEQVEALAARGQPSAARLIAHGAAAVDFAEANRSLPILARGETGPVTGSVAWTETDLLALVAWLHKDFLLKKLDAMIDGVAVDGEALSPEERQRREAEITVDLLLIEREEAALTWRAWSEKLPCEFRADVNPLALLGLRLVTAPSVESKINKT